MSDETVKVGVEYTLHDQASKNAEHMGQSFEKAGHAAHGLGERIGHLRQELGLTLPAMLGVGVGLGVWIEKTKEAVQEFGAAKKAVANTLSSVLEWGKGTTVMDRYSRSTKLAQEVTEQLEDTHARFGPQLSELSAAYRTIAFSAAPLHLTQKQLLTLTQQSAAAAKLYGGNVESAAERIGRALVTKAIRPTDALGIKLYEALGGRGSHKLTNVQVLDKMQKALRDVTGEADLASHGINDSLRQIHHSVEQLFEALGTPLFKEISTELQKAAKYMEQLGASGRPLVEEYAEKLVHAFQTLEKLSGFILDHWKEIALVWGGAKVAGFLSSIGGLAGAGAMAGRAALGATGALAGASVAAVGVLGHDYLTASGKERREYEQKLATDVLPKLIGFFGKGDVLGATKTFDELSNAGVITDKGGFQNKEAMVAALTMSEHLRGRYAEQLGLIPAGMSTGAYLNAQGDARGNAIQIADAFADRLGSLFAAHPEILAGVKPGAPPDNEHENTDSKLKTKGEAPININGNIEMKFNFEEGDPERVMVRFKDELHQLATRRTQSAVLHPYVE